MASSKIVVTRISDEIAHQIEARILEGSLKAGDSLPPERQFAEEFGVSRSSLREAIQKLESRGLLTSRQGGGTYVTDSFHSGFVDPWIGAIGNHPSLAPELFEFRSMIEAQAAAWAAQRATDADLAHLNSVFMQLDAAYRTSDRAAQVQADVAFHQAIADAAHNVLVSQLTASLIKILHEQVAATIGALDSFAEVGGQLMEQHRAILDAIAERDPDAAKAAASCHIEFVRRCNHEADSEAERRERTMRRLR